MDPTPTSFFHFVFPIHMAKEHTMTTPSHAGPVSARPTSSLSTAIWLAGVAALLLWSLSAWALALLLSGGSDFLATQAAAWSHVYPEAELAVSTASAWLAHFGTAALWIAWGFGAVLIVFGTWLVAAGVQALRRGAHRIVPLAAAAWDRAHARRQTRGRDDPAAMSSPAWPAGRD
jgi:hypothetical protein